MLDTRQSNAIKKAIELDEAKAVTRVRFGRYLVRSEASGRTYTVTVDAANVYTCTCPAGEHGNPCHHAASVYLAKLQHGGRVRVVAPAGAPARAAVSDLSGN